MFGFPQPVLLGFDRTCDLTGTDFGPGFFPVRTLRVEHFFISGFLVVRAIRIDQERFAEYTANPFLALSRGRSQVLRDNLLQPGRAGLGCFDSSINFLDQEPGGVKALLLGFDEIQYIEFLYLF